MLFLFVAPRLDDWEKNTLRLKAVENFEKSQHLNGTFILKVVKKENVRTIISHKTGVASKVLLIWVKDITGAKNGMNLWPNHVKFDDIKEGKTYYFENLMTGRYNSMESVCVGPNSEQSSNFSF